MVSFSPAFRDIPMNAGASANLFRIGALPRHEEFRGTVDGLPPGSFSVHRCTGASAAEPKSIGMSEKRHDTATGVVDDVFSSNPEYPSWDLCPPELQELRDELLAAGDTEGLEELASMIVAKAKADEANGVPLYTPTTAPQLPPAAIWLHNSIALGDRKQFYSEVIANCDLSNLSQEDLDVVRDASNQPGATPADVLQQLFEKHGASAEGFDPNSLGQPGDKGLRDLYDLWVSTALIGWYPIEQPVLETYYKLAGKDEWIPSDQLPGREDEIEQIILGYREEIILDPSTGLPLPDESGAPLTTAVPEYGGRVTKNDYKVDADGNPVMQQTFGVDASVMLAAQQQLLFKLGGDDLNGDPATLRQLVLQAQQLNANAGVPPENNVGA